MQLLSWPPPASHPSYHTVNLDCSAPLAAADCADFATSWMDFTIGHYKSISGVVGCWFLRVNYLAAFRDDDGATLQSSDDEAAIATKIMLCSWKSGWTSQHSLHSSVKFSLARCTLHERSPWTRDGDKWEHSEFDKRLSEESSHLDERRWRRCGGASHTSNYWSSACCNLSRSFEERELPGALKHDNGELHSATTSVDPG